MRYKTTKQHKKFWQERKIDWNQHYLSTWDHPHRQMIVWLLESLRWVSLWEVGCGPGANLVKITKSMGGKQLGGSDINADAIELARKTFVGGKFHVEAADDMLLSDDAVDIVLSDATLIYTSPKDIDRTVKELIRVARNQVVLCEFHSTSWWKRFVLRWKTGYNAYNYQALLEKHGCHNIRFYKVPEEMWPGFPWQPWGYLIVANVTKI